MRQAQYFQIAPRHGSEDGAPAAPARVPRQDDDNSLLICISHIPRNHYVETFFDKAFEQRNRNLAGLCGTYKGRREYGLVQCCRENPATFSTVAEKNGTEVSMVFFTARLDDVRELGYELFDDFASSNNFYVLKTLNCNSTNQKTSARSIEKLNFSSSTRSC